MRLSEGTPCVGVELLFLAHLLLAMVAGSAGAAGVPVVVVLFCNAIAVMVLSQRKIVEDGCEWLAGAGLSLAGQHLCNTCDCITLADPVAAWVAPPAAM